MYTPPPIGSWKIQTLLRNGALSGIVGRRFPALCRITLAKLVAAVLLVCGRSADAQGIETVYGWMNEGGEPRAGLVQGRDGHFYGTTSFGGVGGNGTIFRLSTAGEYTVLHFFNGLDNAGSAKEGAQEIDGRNPNAKLIQGRDGHFYGTTVLGGANDKGTIFRISASGEYTILHSFSGLDGSSPSAGLVQGSDGYFYGTTASGGANSIGTIFRVSEAGDYTVLHSLTNVEAGNLSARLVEGSDGHFYGVTSFSRGNKEGAIFRISTAGEYTVLHSFRGTDGSSPRAGMIRGGDGYLYGTTSFGGASNKGTVFRISVAGEFAVLHSFTGAESSNPYTELVQGRDGYFYGATPNGGVSDAGTVYRISAAGEYEMLHSFDLPLSKSQYRSELVQGADGNLYGTTSGEWSGGGTIFRISAAGEIYTILYSFFPSYIETDTASKVMQGSDGHFYGTTYYGGSHGFGSIFKVSVAGEHTVLHSFNDADGSKPRGSLLLGSDGYFYGTASSGGANGKGTIYRVSASGEVTVLYSFDGTNGSTPCAKLLQGSDGYFYGTAWAGGTNNKGVVFRVNVAGEYAALHSFDDTNGSGPVAGVVQGSDGYLYGSTNAGGKGHRGVVFRISTTGEYTVLHQFDGTDGEYPYAELVQGNDGYFYGTATSGGANGYGVIFRISSAGEYTVLHSFRTNDGGPRSGLVQGGDDRFYGTAEFGGEGRYGTIFQISRNGEYAVLHSFRETGGRAPRSTPVIGTDGNLWGTTSRGSDYTAGTLYRLALKTVTLPPVTLPAGKVTYSSGILRAEVARHSGGIVQFEYGTDPTLSVPEYTNLLPLSAGANATVISAPLSGLEPGTTYYYRPRVRREGIPDQFGEILSFTTGLAEPQTTVLATKGAAVPGAGNPDSGIPPGAIWGSFGVPALAGNSQLAFHGKLQLPSGSMLTGIFAGDPASPVLTLKKGDAPTGVAGGSVFTFFKDPLSNNAGELAFIGTVSGGGKNKQGIWSSAGALSGKPELVALQGANAAGISSGATWKTFTSVALSDTGVIFFTATLEKGRGGVTAANDIGLWHAKSSGTLLLLREGQVLELDGVSRKVKRFVALSSGQGRFTADGTLPVKVIFSDDTQTLLRFSVNGNPEVIAASGDVVLETAGSRFRSFGMPALNQAGNAVFAATIQRTIANVYTLTEYGIFSARDGDFDVVALKGGVAPGVMRNGAPARFVSFGDPLINAEGRVAFTGTATGGVKGVWWSRGAGDDLAPVTSTAIATVPGADGARFAAFKSVALPDGELAGPLFVAKLEGKGITPSNDVGLWAVDSEGVLRLIVREGNTVDGKVLRSFTFLSTVPKSSAQPRSYDAQRQVIYRAFFTDGSQSLMNVRLP